MKGRTVILWMLAVLVTGCLVSCSKEEDPQGRTYQKVLLLYSAGYNNLCADLREDIKEMCQDAPTRFLSGAYKVVVFSHLKKSRYDNTPVSPLLMDATLEPGGKVKLDTLVRYPSSTVSASAQVIEDVLSYVKENYPAREYGMIISSHASGWVPEGYFNNPEDEESGSWDDVFFLSSNTTPHWESYYTAERPEVKALCYQDTPSGLGLEVDLDDFADAIRANGLHFNYIVFDMCLMGCVEVAYELRDVVDYVAFSPTEVISDGFAYKTILQRLLYSPSADIVGVCTDYFDQYVRSGKSATVSAVDCRRMDNLVSVCTDLFARYYGRIMALDQNKVQPYCTQRRYFFDLRDALVRAGISSVELSRLDESLRQCVLYHNETAIFSVLGEYFRLENCCGLSMYLPDSKRPILNEAYKELAWNKATSLVK